MAGWISGYVDKWVDGWVVDECIDVPMGSWLARISRGETREKGGR